MDKLDSKRVGVHYSEALNYPLAMPDGSVQWPGGFAEKSTAGWNWLWSKTKVEWGVANDFIVFKKVNDKWNVYNKRYLKVDSSNKSIERTIPFRNLILSNQFNTAQGTSEITSLFGEREFDYPKPSSFIKYLLNTSIRTNPDSLILDFFSGSATTAHACMKLNAEDGGTRKFIMVQLPVECEPSSAAAKAGFRNICEIGKERIRRAGKKILGEHPERQGTLDVGFKVYRLSKSNIKPYTPTTGSDETALELALGSMEAQITPLRDGFDFQNTADIQSLLTEILLRQGFALDSRIEKSTSVAGNTLYRIIDEKRPIQLNVCLDRSIARETVHGIAFGENDKFVCLNSAISDELYAQLSDKGRVETL